MLRLDELWHYCDELLAVGTFDDYCPNGLQVEAGEVVTHLVSGVTASQALIEAALELGADTLLVHHGYFWKGESPRLTGIKGRRIRTLMQGGISLLAYHLPLDAHPELGNNRQLAEHLDILDPQPLAGNGLLWQGRLEPALTAVELGERLAQRLGRSPLHIPVDGRLIRRLGWCTGAGQGLIEQAAQWGLDAFLSGEISEQTVHQARELGIQYFSAGHHATERFGVAALGEHLAAHFGISHRFLDLPNPA